MDTGITRHPAGSKQGGRFAAHQHAEPAGTLDSDDTPGSGHTVSVVAASVTPPGGWGRTGVREGSRTPWGRADHVKAIAPGITAVATPSHGGVKLAPERNEKVHPALREPSGWYEEDSDWAKVAMTFPEEEHYREIEEIALDPANPRRDMDAVRDGISHAERLVRDWYPDEYEKATGKTIRPGQSYERDRKLFSEANRD